MLILFYEIQQKFRRYWLENYFKVFDGNMGPY